MINTIKPIISIVMLVWNSPRTTEIALEALYRHTTTPFELIIVNQKSNDETYEVLKKYSSIEESDKYDKLLNVKLISNSYNIGISKGFNIGINAVHKDSKYVGLFSNDWVVTQGWDKDVIDAFDLPKLGILTQTCNHSATSNIDEFYDMEKPEIDQDKPIDEILYYTESIQKILDEKNNTIIQGNDFGCMGWMMRREFIDTIGKLPEDINLKFDVAYSRMVQKAGYNTMVIWSRYLHHFVRSSVKQIPDDELKKMSDEDDKLINTDERFKI